MSVTTSPTRRQSKPRPRPLLSYRLHFPPLNGRPGLLTVWQGKTAQDYEILPLASDFGIAYTVGKLSQGGPVTTYHVCLDAENGSEGRHICDCAGHERYGYCKHVRALLRLHERGELRVAEYPE